MDSATPFQPWTDSESTKNVKIERELVDDAKHRRENVNHPKHTQTASYDKDSDGGTCNAPGPSSAAGSSGDPARSKESMMDSSKIASMQQIVENTLSQEGRQRVVQLLEAVEALTGAEKLLLYLRLPTGVPIHDPLKQPVNPLGSRTELQQTVTWIQTHLEVDPDVSLPKQDVYDEYIAHCMSSNMKPLSTADFGKVMKQVYPTVRPRRLGTRGNSRYCYAGLRKKIKLEVPQLPDLGESSKESNVVTKEAERIVCDWAENKLGLKFGSISELSRHVVSIGATQVPPRPPSGTPPPLIQPHGIGDESANRQVMKHLKRKLQTHGTPGRPKKNKAQDIIGESPPSTSYVSHHPPIKHETEMVSEIPGTTYGYQPAYMPPIYEARPQYAYAPPTRTRPPPAPPSHPSMVAPEFRTELYYEPLYHRELPPDPAHNVPINLSTDASLDLSTDRTDWQRRRPPEPPPARLPLPGKKFILETYQSETQASSPRPPQTEPRAPPNPSEEFPRAEYLPKKMRAAEISGGKLAASRQAAAEAVAASSSASGEPPSRSDVAFLEDPKNVTSRSISTAAALAREQQEAASPTQSVKAPTLKTDRKLLKTNRTKETSTNRVGHYQRLRTPDTCCGLDGINIKTGMICEEKHTEILNRERVDSVCNIDKHALDDYLNEGNSQEHEEELLQYFQRGPGTETNTEQNPSDDPASFLEAGLDPQDDHSQGKNEKLSQLRELLAKNLKNPSGSSSQNMSVEQKTQSSQENQQVQQSPKSVVSEGAFKTFVGAATTDTINGQVITEKNDCNNSIPDQNGVSLPFDNTPTQVNANVGQPIYNGNCHNVPQSPTTRTQQYDFVPISDGCHSPGNIHSKSPVGFGQRSSSPSKPCKSFMFNLSTESSLQTSPISHSTAASPFVSPRNTPVPRSRYFSRPIPKPNGRKRRNPISLGMVECSKQFAIPSEQKFMSKNSALNGPGIKYSQPMSAPPSPNILTSQFKNQMFLCNNNLPNGSSLGLNFIPNTHFPEHSNGDIPQPLSADPLSNEVSQFFQEPLMNYRAEHDSSFRSQSVPLKQGMNVSLQSYNNTPAGSVPPTPVPNEFCDFESLADTCDISRAGLNPETLVKIYDVIDSNSDMLNTGSTQSLLNSNDALSNGCDQLPQQQMLTDELSSLIQSDGDMLTRTAQYNHSYTDDAATSNVDDFLKRTNSIEFNFTDLENEKSKYYTSRSVPSTPLPYKRTSSNLHIDSRRSRELFTANENFANTSNSISSKSVPSTPQLAEERNVFNYSNRDFLINGNSLEVCGNNQVHGAMVDSQALGSPLHDILRDEITEPLTPAADLLADLDKIDGTPYDEL